MITRRYVSDAFLLPDLGSDLPDVPDTTGFPVGNVFW